MGVVGVEDDGLARQLVALEVDDADTALALPVGVVVVCEFLGAHVLNEDLVVHLHLVQQQLVILKHVQAVAALLADDYLLCVPDGCRIDSQAESGG